MKIVPSAQQILGMLRSRAEGDDDSFFSIALQIAASEARQGRKTTAEEMRAEIERARAQKSRGPSIPIAFGAPRGSVEGLLEMREPRYKLSDVVLNPKLVDRIADVIRQQRKREWLREKGKVPARRLLFVGPPGSGKTMSAEAFAGELNLPLYVIRLEGLITKYMGETASKLRLVFDETAKRRGVYLFDEFDAVGGHRTSTNDVAEMRRVLNSFLQFMEEENSTDSLVICATNFPSLLDRALLRRYDQVLEFEAPNQDQVKEILINSLSPMRISRPAWRKILNAALNLSQSELVRAADDAVKTAIISGGMEFANVDVRSCEPRCHYSWGVASKNATRISRRSSNLTNKSSVDIIVRSLSGTGRRRVTARARSCGTRVKTSQRFECRFCSWRGVPSA